MALLDLATDEGCRRLVCAGFCTFFKPVPADDDRCGGLGEVERRLAEACADPEMLAGLKTASIRLVEAENPVSYRFDAELYEVICRACPFVSGGDCEHRDPGVDAEARLEPCGGYILLAALAEMGVISLDRR